MDKKFKIIFIINFLSLLFLVKPVLSESNFQAKFTPQELKNAPVKIIPYPQNITWKRKTTNINELKLIGSEKLSDSNLEELQEIASSYNIRIKAQAPISISFEIDATIQKEGYYLSILDNKILIKVVDQAGFFYAFQTIRQLLNRSTSGTNIYSCIIEDYPAYPARGFMLDVGRNFQSLSSLKRQLDIMARYKLNLFHWHLTDRPAWRIESKIYPQLNDSANHRPTRDSGEYYSYDEIRELMKYARQKHIQILPEIDMPGHSDSFTEAMGVRMESKKGMQYLENILVEFFQEIPVQDCPQIHLGSDEIHIPNPDEFISRMVNICERNDREVVIWSPGLNATSNVIRQTWQAKHVKKSNFKEIDSWNSYINNGEPMTQILKLFFKPLGYQSENEIIGGILCLWPDVNIDEENDAFWVNPHIPSLLTYAWKTWTSDVQKSNMNFLMTLPPRESKAFQYFAEFEEYLLAHKKHFTDNEGFVYYKQCDKKWKLIGPFDNDDGDKILTNLKSKYTYNNKNISWKNGYGNTLVINDRFNLGGYYPQANPGQAIYALTFIHSNKNRKIETLIGFETPLRANRTYTGMPKNGSWDPNGGWIKVNGEKLPGPHWDNPGWKPSRQSGWGSSQDQENPWRKEELYWTREPAKIALQKGWNKILVKIPYQNNYQNCMFTFIPMNMDGLKFSNSLTRE